MWIYECRILSKYVTKVSFHPCNTCVGQYDNRVKSILKPILPPMYLCLHQFWINAFWCVIFSLSAETLNLSPISESGFACEKSTGTHCCLPQEACSPAQLKRTLFLSSVKKDTTFHRDLHCKEAFTSL